MTSLCQQGIEISNLGSCCMMDVLALLGLDALKSLPEPLPALISVSIVITSITLIVYLLKSACQLPLFFLIYILMFKSMFSSIILRIVV